MARRFNTPFFLIIVGTVLLAAVVIGGLVFMKTRSDPVRHIRRGEAYMKEGEFKEAHASFLRAIGKEGYSPEYYDMAIDALLRITPETQEDADARFGTYMGLLFKKGEILPSDEAFASLKEGVALNRATIDGVEGQPGKVVLPLFENLSRQFEGYADIPEADEEKAWLLNHVYEHEWRFANLLTETEWEEAEKRLSEMVAMDPTNAYNQYALLRAKFDRAVMDLESNARRRKGEREMVKFNDDLAKAREEAGDAPEFDFLEFERDYIAYISGRQTEPPSMEILERIPEGYDKDDDRWRLKEVFMRTLSLGKQQILAGDQKYLFDVLTALINLRGQLADRLYSFDPDDVRNIQLFIATRLGDDIPKAQELAVELSESEMPTVSVNAKLHNKGRLQAANFLFKALYAEAANLRGERDKLIESGDANPSEQAEIEAEFEASLVALRESHAFLSKLIAEGGGTESMYQLQIDLDLAHAEANWDKALSQLNRLVAQGARLDSGKLLIAADVAMRAGDFGAAAKFVEDVITIRPDLRSDPSFGLIRTRLAMSSGEFEKAAAIAKQVLKEVESTPGGSPEIAVQAKRMIRQSERRANPLNSETDPLSSVFAEALRANAVGDASEQRSVFAAALSKLEMAEPQNDQEAEENEVQMLRLLSAMAVFEATDMEGDSEQAKVYAARILSLDENNRVGRLIGEVAGKNTVESLRAVSSLADPDDENMRNDRFWIVLQNEAIALQNKLTRAASDPGAFSSAELAKFESDLALIQTEIKSLEAAVSERTPESELLLRYQVNSAIRAGDITGAKEALEGLVALKGTSWRTTLLEAQILRLNGELAAAVDLLRNAISQGQSNSAILRIYGRTLMEQGQPEEGIAALSNAYQNSPGDPNIALDYSIALYITGNANEALQVLRRSSAIGRNNEAFLRRWLAMESQLGSSNVALKERARIWDLNPADWKNAVELGKILISADVDWRSIYNPETNRLMFNERDWARLSPSQKNKYTDEIRRKRAKESQDIFNELLARPKVSPLVYVACADTFEEQGMRQEALDLLKGHIADPDASIGSIERAMIAVDVARRHLHVAEPDEAEIWISKARELQPEGNPVADKALVTLWQSQNKPIRLANSLKNVIELDQSEIGIENRVQNNRLLVRALLDANQVSEANQLHEENFKGSELIEDLLLSGAINVELASEANVNGDDAIAEARFNEAVATFEKAAALNPGSLEPPLQLARLFDLRHQWFGNSEDIEKAIDFGRIAVSKLKSSWIAQELLCVLLVRNAQLDAASGALEDFLRRAPDNDDARFMLVQMYESMDKLDRAVELCQEAVDRNPYSIPWNVRLGRYRGEQGRFNEAASAFKRLFDMTGDVVVARFYVDSKLRRDPPDYQSVLAFSRGNVKLIREDPYLAGAYASTMAYGGRTEKAFEELENSYRRFRDAGASASQMQQLSSWIPRILRAMGEDQDIAEQSEVIIDTFSDGNPDIGSRIVLGNEWAASGDENLSKAIEHYTAINAQDSSSHDLSYIPASALGSLLYRQGDCAGALKYFERASEIDPLNSQLLNNIAYTRAICDGDLEQALRDARLAVELDPIGANVLDTLGFVYLKRGDLKAAEVALQKSIGRKKDASSLSHLAEVRIEQRRFNDAEILLKNAGDLDPTPSEQEAISGLIDRIENEKKAG